MAGMVPYVTLPGTAAEALTFYADVFGGTAVTHSFDEFQRTDGPAEAVAHGYLENSPVVLFAADAAGDERPLHTEGLMLSLLGTADPDVMSGWFAKLSDDGNVIDELAQKPWGDWDGQVVDRFGLHWLIGFQGR